jgi:serine/threonine protein kinase/tetratricopeptide (TPR) repeat protein
MNMPITPDPARDLLFGLLALQNGLIDQGELVAAFQAWTREKSRPLADHLVVRRNLDGDDRAAVEALVARHLKKTGGDVEQSLMAIPVGRSTRESLIRLGDAGLEASLTHLASVTTQAGEDDDRTTSYSVGSTTSEGQRFRVLRPHAKGGLGAVFVALDVELHREVALKQILEKHADDPTSRQRFLVEAEITGGLEHPGIVPIYGLGTYSDGRPYYAMRFIRGDSLKVAIEQFHRSRVGSAVRTEMHTTAATLAETKAVRTADPTGLELRRLLRRFLDVCNAIDYAHSRGVIHRDLKPGNVIVGRHGETLVVDWGLAKALGRVEPGSESDERTLVPHSVSGTSQTLPGLALGTPAYMSPEQARGDLGRMGPQSDVYSLGATLYCLLTGRPAIETNDVGEALHAAARGEFPPPREFDPALDPALEAVCLKAMALNPEDRYSSPKALAEEVERWMADEPVIAWPEPFSRRMRRWARRNRTTVTATAMALVVGVVGLGAVAAVQAQSNSRLRDANFATTLAKLAAEEALSETERAKKAAEFALVQSEESRKQTQAVSTFLVEAFRSPDPAQDGRTVKVADMLKNAAEKLEFDLTVPHAIKGALLDALGQTNEGLGLYDRAVSLHTQAVQVREAVLGPEHPDTLSSRCKLGGAYRVAGRITDAIALLVTTLKQQLDKLGPDHPDTLDTRGNLANAYWSANRTAEAITLHETNLKLRESKQGPDHPGTLASRNNLANDYWQEGRIGEAIQLQERNLELRAAKLGSNHPETLTTRSNLALAYWSAGRTTDAIVLDETTLKLRDAVLGPAHPDTLTTRNNLANAYKDAGRLIDAIAMHAEALKMSEAAQGPDHPDTLLYRNNLATEHEALGQWTEAEHLRRVTLARRRKIEKPDSIILAHDLVRLGRLLTRLARWSEAESALREALTIQEKAGVDDWVHYLVRSLLGGALLGQGHYTEAQPLIVQGYKGMIERIARMPTRENALLIDAAERVVRLYETWGGQKEATEWKTKLGMPDLPPGVFAPP